MSKKERPDCYDCKWRFNILGDAHSACSAPEGTKVKGHSAGIQGGWFMWPYNFDPTWLESCTGFTKR